MLRLLTPVLLFASFATVAEECPGFSPVPNAPTKCDLNQLNNNEVADAGKVMENFNKLGDAIDALPTPPTDCTTDQIIRYDGSAWACADETGSEDANVRGWYYTGSLSIDTPNQTQFLFHLTSTNARAYDLRGDVLLHDLTEQEDGSIAGSVRVALAGVGHFGSCIPQGDAYPVTDPDWLYTWSGNSNRFIVYLRGLLPASELKLEIICFPQPEPNP